MWDRLVRALGNKWSEIAEDFPGKSPAACRLHYMLIDKDYDPRQPKGEAAKEKKKVTEGSKSARPSPRKRGRKGSEQSFQ
jgi:hypothetical protein